MPYDPYNKELNNYAKEVLSKHYMKMKRIVSAELKNVDDQYKRNVIANKLDNLHPETISSTKVEFLFVYIHTYDKSRSKEIEKYFSNFISSISAALKEYVDKIDDNIKIDTYPWGICVIVDKNPKGTIEKEDPNQEAIKKYVDKYFNKWIQIAKGILAKEDKKVKFYPISKSEFVKELCRNSDGNKFSYHLFSINYFDVDPGMYDNPNSKGGDYYNDKYYGVVADVAYAITEYDRSKASGAIDGFDFEDDDETINVTISLDASSLLKESAGIFESVEIL